jgi:hypothetical protein
MADRPPTADDLYRLPTDEDLGRLQRTAGDRGGGLRPVVKAVA